MPLSAGDRLGPYEVLSMVGSGGMGEVYSARDTRLNRTVAIKVSAAQFSERFEREARAVAALNHPNICTLYDVGPNYLVMEFIDGQTLDRQIPAAGMRLADALRIAIRVADGLAAAHKLGIIHRDLKPGNVMVTGEGAVKLLDFGLAAMEEAPLAATESTIVAGQKTVEGTILGTFRYMSPEQAEGRKLDPRSDLFSFGSLLYEMLTGQPPFRAQSTMATLAAIINQEPKPLGEVAAHVPGEVERIVTRCLRKDPDRRFQHASDLRVELQELADAQSTGAFATAAVESRKPRRQRPWMYGAVAVGALIAGLVGGWMAHRPPPPFQGPKLTRATFDSGLTCDPAISPDGKLLAYASDRAGKGNLDIWVQPVTGGDPVQLTTDGADDSEPSFSPDGSQLVYRSERDGGGIYVIGAIGGQPMLIARAGRTPRFSPDGTQIAYWTGKGGRSEELSRQGGRIFVVSAGGGEPRPIATKIFNAASPVWSPDGRQLLFAGVVQATRGRIYTWYITALADDRPAMTNARTVLEGLGDQMPAPGQWLPSNQVIFSERHGGGANLYRIGIDSATSKVNGPAQQLTFGGGFEDAPTVAANGVAAMADLTWNFDIWSLPMDSRTARVTGDPARLTDSLVTENRPALSADGSTLAYTSTQPQQVSTWVSDLASGKTRRVLSVPSGGSTPFLSADGSTLVYSRSNGNARTLFTIPTSGGLGQRVLDDTGVSNNWTPSGKIVHAEKILGHVGVLDPKTRTSQRLLEVRMPLYQTSFSRDEEAIAFMTVPSGQIGQVFVAPATGTWPIPQSEWIAVTDGTQWDDKPRWSPDGGILYMTSDRDGYRCLWARRMDPRAHRPVGELFPVQHFHSSRRSMLNVSLTSLELAVAPNRIAFVQGEVTGNVWLVKLP